MSILAYKGDFDWGRKIFFVIVLVVWGVKALGEWWKTNREQILGKFKQLDEELKKRSRELQEQGGDEPVLPPRPPAYQPPPVAVRRPVVVTQYQPTNVSVPEPQAAAAPQTVAPSVAKSSHPLTGFLRQRDSLRRAVVLKEVLGAPKALQMDGDHSI